LHRNWFEPVSRIFALWTFGEASVMEIAACTFHKVVKLEHEYGSGQFYGWGPKQQQALPKKLFANVAFHDGRFACG
jgi:hypothetical protein